MKKYVSEIFAELQAATKDEDKMKILRSSVGNTTFINVLVNIYHPKVEFYFNEENFPDYKVLVGTADYSEISFEEAMRRSYLFIKGHPKASDNITDKQRENLLINILEGLAEKEAEAYKTMILKKQPAKRMTKAFMKKAFPLLVPYGEK